MGRSPFGFNYDQDRIAIGWRYLKTGTPQHCNFQKKYHEGINVPEYDLKGVKSKMCTFWEDIIQASETNVVKDIMNLMTYPKCVNAVVEPVMGYLDHTAMARSYGLLKPWRGKIDLCLRNHSAKQI